MSTLTNIERYLRQKSETEGRDLYVIPHNDDKHDERIALNSTEPVLTSIAHNNEDTMKKKTIWSRSTNLVDLNTSICECTQCPLGATRT